MNSVFKSPKVRSIRKDQIVLTILFFLLGKSVSTFGNCFRTVIEQSRKLLSHIQINDRLVENLTANRT